MTDAAAPFEPTFVPVPADECLHTVIGPYKLLQKLGEGGMGTVYLAEQETPVCRRVALKVIKPGMDSAQVVARFEAERQALALMDHPHISRVFDAGTTAAGTPYFVMELVRGVPITQYCDDNRLTPRERLQLLIPVCQAIQHAHQKGVIHRDIKPSNILVALYDGKPVPKVIDFGVAKATHQRLTDLTLFTGFGSVVGTLEYMSPEQAEMNVVDIDTRSDIYSLGVLLYELLTGTTPLMREQLRSAAFSEILRIIREVEPPRPSFRLGQSGAALATISSARKTEPGRLSKLVRGELDWIVMKTLEKDRGRRYETANGLARDIERYLNDEPVEAGPPSAAYKLKKLARRYRKTLAIAVAFALLLVAGVVVSAWQAMRASEAREAAQQSAARAETLNRFLVDHFLTAAEPGRNPRDRPVTLEEALDKASEKVDESFAGQPELEASIRHTLGATYTQLGLFPRAIPHLQKALAIRRDLFGAQRYESMDTADRLGHALQRAGQVAEAEQMFRSNLEASRQALGPDHKFSLQCLNNLAALLFDLRRLDEAETLNRECLEAKQRLLGPDAYDTLITEANLATVQHHQGKLADSETLYLRALETLRRTSGPTHPSTLLIEQNFVQLLKDQGKLDQADELGRRNLEAQRRVYGAGHPYTVISMNQLELVAQLWTSQDRHDRAEPILRECLAVRRETGPDDWSTFHIQSLLGGALLGEQNYAAAEPLLTEAYEGLRETAAAIPKGSEAVVPQALERVVRLYEEWGKPDQAAAFRKKLPE